MHTTADLQMNIEKLDQNRMFMYALFNAQIFWNILKQWQLLNFHSEVLLFFHTFCTQWAINSSGNSEGKSGPYSPTRYQHPEYHNVVSNAMKNKMAVS